MQAIQIDPDDERGNDDVYQSTIEGEKPSRPPSIRDSMQRLIPIDARSIPSSVGSSLKSTKLICTRVVDLFKSFFMNTKLFWFTVVFTVLGGFTFQWLEVPADLASKTRAQEHHLIARDVLLWNIEMIHNSSSYQKRNEWKAAIMHFEGQIGRRLPVVETDWTFWQAVLYAGTISTTIGYGNIGCRTVAGRTASMIYAILGIPLMIVILDQLGASLLVLLKQVSYVVDDFCFFFVVRTRLRRLKDERERKQYRAIARRYAKLGFFTYRMPPRPLVVQQRAAADLDRAVVVEEANLVTSRPPSTRKSSTKSAVVDETAEQPGGQEMNPLVDGEAEGEPADAEETRGSQADESQRNSASLSSSIKAVVDETEESVELEEQREEEEAAAAEAEEQKKAVVREVEEEEEEERDPPVVAALITTIGCIALSAWMFCFWEDWDYFTSFYFFFISLSTIGFGDVIPDYPEYVVAAFSLVLIGLALVTVCINVVQEKISLIYMRLLSKMLEKYMKAQEAGDPEALKGFVTGFNSQAKFLMPLISKNESAKVMKRFKARAKARGIELPAALTDVDPKTGKPAFCSADSENIDAFVEQKKQEAQAVLLTPAFQQNTCGTQTFLSHGHKHRRLQTEVPEWCLEAFSFGSQFGAEFQDAGAQTDTESVDSGVQCEVEIRTVDTQFDPQMISTDASTSMDIQYTTTGIQPEVSFVMQLLDEDADLSSPESDSDRYVGESSDDEAGPRVRLQREQLQKRSSVEKRDRRGGGSLRYMRDQDIQTEWSTESRGEQAGPSSFTGFKEASSSTFVRRLDAEVQMETRVKEHATQTKTKFKEIGIQNRIMNSLQVETETQVERLDHECSTQTELTTAEQQVQATELLRSQESQTDVVEFLELKAVVEAGVQTAVHVHNRKAQTHLSSTMKDPETYQRQKEEFMQSAKHLFERERAQRLRSAQRRRNVIPLDENEVEILKKRLFNIRREKARELKMENEMIKFDTNEEIEKLLEVLKKIRMSEENYDADQLRELLRDNEFPIERIENDFDFDVLLNFLREESEKGDFDEEEDLLMFSRPQETQTEIVVFHRKDAEVSAVREVAESEQQTEISAFGRAEAGTSTTITVADCEVQTTPSVEEKASMTESNTRTDGQQTDFSFFKTRSQDVQTTTSTAEQPTQTTATFAEVGCDPIAEVVQANLPSVWSTDTQTPLPQLHTSGTQSEDTIVIDTGIQATPEMRNAEVEAVVGTKEAATEYVADVSAKETQTVPSTVDRGVGDSLESAEAEIQTEIERREVGIQPDVSAFKVDRADELPENVFFMIDTGVQYEDPRVFVDTGTLPEVSMLATEERGEEGVLRMVEAGVQYEDPRSFRSVGTAPKVSMFKPKSVDEGGQAAEETSGEEIADFFLNDVGVQHDRQMEEKQDVGIQPRVSVIKSKSGEKKEDDDADVHFMVDAEVQHEIVMVDAEAGEHLETVDSAVQPSTSMFHKRKGTGGDPAVYFMTESSTQHDLQMRNADVQTQVPTQNAEVQVQPPTAHSSQQTTSEFAVASSQTEVQQKDSGTQTTKKNRTSVTQTSIEVVDAASGAQVETAEAGIQPEISMFRLEDVRRTAEDGGIPTGLRFMTDSSTSTDPRFGRLSVGVQYERAGVSNAEVQTFYTGSLPEQYEQYRKGITKNSSTQTGVLARLQHQYKEPPKIIRRTSGSGSSKSLPSPKPEGSQQ